MGNFLNTDNKPVNYGNYQSTYYNNYNSGHYAHSEPNIKEDIETDEYYEHYYGHFKDKKRHGYGKCVWEKKVKKLPVDMHSLHVYRGQWKNDRMSDGELEYLNQNIFEGKFDAEENILSGKKTFAWGYKRTFNTFAMDELGYGDARPVIIINSVEDGLFNGELYILEVLKCRGLFNENLLKKGVGIITIIDNNQKCIYNGDIDEYVPHGTGTIFYNNYDEYVGAFKNGLKDGPGKYLDNAFQKEYNQIYKNDILIESIKINKINHVNNINLISNVEHIQSVLEIPDISQKLNLATTPIILPNNAPVITTYDNEYGEENCEENGNSNDDNENSIDTPHNLNCVECKKNPKNILFQNCNHVVCCAECKDKIYKCPVCNFYIGARFKEVESM